ncbi:MAG: hypothetical protein H7249_06295 [Chitinophagaceae bacterium]|nr:hypothetical protein [Oligoflexus sp.]
MNIQWSKLLLAASVMLPLSCGAAKTVSTVSSLPVDNNAFSNASQLFNFAHLVTVQPALAKLVPYVGPGEAYLFFGDKDKFRVETNLTVDANGGLTATGSRYIRSDYYLDGYIFGRQLANSSLIDMQAKADFNAMKVTGYVRFLGDDKYNGEVKVGIDKTFIRDISYDKVIYGMPMLGVSVSATLGGELGMRAAPGLRADLALTASFEPRVQLSGTGVINLTALQFLSARAEGQIEILNMKLSTTAALGTVPASKFVYANMSMDGATIKALDGRIDLYAEAGGSGLPKGVSSLLWSLVGLGGTNEWHHTLWDPAPAYLATADRFGKTVIGFWQKPGVGIACITLSSGLKSELSGRLGALEKEDVENGDEYLALIVKSNIAGLNEVMKLVDGYCADPLANSFSTLRTPVHTPVVPGATLSVAPAPNPTPVEPSDPSSLGDPFSDDNW